MKLEVILKINLKLVGSPKTNCMVHVVTCDSLSGVSMLLEEDLGGAVLGTSCKKNLLLCCLNYGNIIIK